MTSRVVSEARNRDMHGRDRGTSRCHEGTHWVLLKNGASVVAKHSESGDTASQNTEEMESECDIFSIMASSIYSRYQ